MLLLTSLLSLHSLSSKVLRFPRVLFPALHGFIINFVSLLILFLGKWCRDAPKVQASVNLCSALKIVYVGRRLCRAIRSAAFSNFIRVTTLAAFVVILVLSLWPETRVPF